MSEPLQTLHYVTDPMCSWCWGFAPVLAQLEARLKPTVALRYVMGGLAPDSTEPMPAETRAFVQSAWRAVEARTGAPFAHEFWERHQPSRSTWPACRAVLAAEELRPGTGVELFGAIQRAYYQEARDPSDPTTLIALAGELDPPLDEAEFREALVSDRVQRLLESDFALRDRLGTSGFPALVLSGPGGESRPVCRGWAPAPEVLARLAELAVLA